MWLHHTSYLWHLTMDVLEENQSAKFIDSSKAFEDMVKDHTWHIQGITQFITTTHREGYTLCNEHTTHMIKAALHPMIKVPTHQIELVIQRAWHSVLKPHDRWHLLRAKRLCEITEDRLSSDKDWCSKAESDLATAKSEENSLEKELEELCKEFKMMGKHKASPASHQSPVTCRFCEWESTLDSKLLRILPSVGLLKSDRNMILLLQNCVVKKGSPNEPSLRRINPMVFSHHPLLLLSTETLFFIPHVLCHIKDRSRYPVSFSHLP